MRPPTSSSMTMSSTITTTSITTASIDSITITSSLSGSTTMTSTPEQGNAGNGVSTILTAVSAVIVLLVVTIIVILIVSVVVFRKKGKLSLPASSSTRNGSDSNHVYTNISGNDKGRLGAVNNPNYEPQGIVSAFILSNIFLLHNCNA